MSAITIIPDSEFKTTRWSGGSTTELFIWPEGSSYKDRRFSVRISTALVEAESSVFTRLEGVRRLLTPLCPGFLLTVNGRELELKRGEVLDFSGEDDVACVGRGRDLNLMLKGAEGGLSMVNGAFTVRECSRAFLFAPEETAVSYCREACTSAFLPALTFAVIEPGEYFAEKTAALFELFIGD